MNVSGGAPIMVLVTLQHHCVRLIRKAADMALRQRCPLKVVHVAHAQDEGERSLAMNVNVLNDLYALAGEVGAEMCVLTSPVMVTAVAEYAKGHQIKQVVMGDGKQAHGIAETLSELLPGIAIFIID